MTDPQDPEEQTPPEPPVIRRYGPGIRPKREAKQPGEVNEDNPLGGSVGAGFWDDSGDPEFPEESAASAPAEAEPPEEPPPPAPVEAEQPNWDDDPYDTGPRRTLGVSDPLDWDEKPDPPPRPPLGATPPTWDEPSEPSPRHALGPEPSSWSEPSDTGPRHALGGSDPSAWDEPSDPGPRHAVGGSEPSAWDEPSDTGPRHAVGGAEPSAWSDSSDTGPRHALGGSEPSAWDEPSESGPRHALGGAEPSSWDEPSDTGPRHALGGSEPSAWDEPSDTGPRHALGGAEMDPAVAAAYRAEAAQAADTAETEEEPRPEALEVPESAEGPLGTLARRGAKAADRMVGLVGFRYPTAALVLLAVLALYGVAALSRPDGQARAGAGVRAPVPGAVLACPAPAQARLSALAPASAQKGGKAEVLASTKDATPVAALPGPGTNWFQDLKAAPDSYTVRALGPPAAGLEVERTIHFPKGDDRGLAGVRCTPPGVDQWFLGSGPVEAKDIDLYITNVDAQPAAVDVSALSGEGPLDTTDGRGIPVEPYTTKVIHIGKSPEGLGTIVTTARVLGLRVRAGAGRVSAAVRVRIDKGKGVDWMPLSPRPATSLVVPGLPGGGGLRRLLVAVPGEADARIKIQAITAAGVFAPGGQDTLDAPAQTVTPLDLEKALTGKPAAIRLTSDRPIVAGFTAYRGADVAYGAATEPLGASGGVVADNRFDTSVLLTAPDGAATVRITGIPVQGQPAAPQEVKVAAGRTLEVRLAPPPGADKGYGALIVPLPGSGPVHAARVLSTGKDSDILFTVLPVVPALTTVLLPPVADSQTALTP